MSTQTSRLVAIYTLLLVGNVAAAVWAWALCIDHAILIGTATLAYALGLRHAVDADHILAIDNVTRKLVQNGDKPLTVGLYFSLGHSTVVVLACWILGLAAADIFARFADVREIADMLGTVVSALFLVAVALANVSTLETVWRRIRDTDPKRSLTPSGLLGRLIGPLLGHITKSWQMFPLGFLFGLGFDTASEVSLLGASAAAASHRVGPWSILVFPALFAAGMTLIGTTEALLMRGAYGWALAKPQRRFAYNVVITLFSVIAALIIGALEALRLIANGFSLEGSFWKWIDQLGNYFEAVGCIIVLVPVAYWIAAMVWRRRESGLLQLTNQASESPSR